MKVVEHAVDYITNLLMYYEPIISMAGPGIIMLFFNVVFPNIEDI